MDQQALRIAPAWLIFLNLKVMQLSRLVIFMFLWSSLVIGQSQIEALVAKGVQHHDVGDYEQAIATYKQALAIDPASALVNYELSYSYFAKGDYEQAIHFADVVLKQKQDFLMEAYVNKGSSLNMLGRSNEAIKVYKKGIKKTGGHYLLHYNLSLAYIKANDLAQAEKSCIAAILVNPKHASSHLLLANLSDHKGDKIPSLLATYYFLMLEPNTSRTPEGLRFLDKNFNSNVSRGENQTINILFSPNGDDEWSTIELMLSMIKAKNFGKEGETKTAEEIFEENTASFFSLLGTMKERKNKGIFWDFYTPFFYDLSKSEHLTAFCHSINQSRNASANEWVQANQAKVLAFEQWVATK